MKYLVLAILIVFVPALFMGCEKDGNIVEKLTPEPTMEEKYGEEVIAMFESQTAIPKWREYLEYADKGYQLYRNTSVGELEKREKDILKKIRGLNINEYRSARSILPGKETLFKDVLACWKEGLDIAGARKKMHSLYHTPPHPKARAGIVTVIDKMIVAVYSRQGNVDWMEIKVAVLYKHYLLPHQEKIVSKVGL